AFSADSISLRSNLKTAISSLFLALLMTVSSGLTPSAGSIINFTVGRLGSAFQPSRSHQSAARSAILFRMLSTRFSRAAVALPLGVQSPALPPPARTPVQNAGASPLSCFYVVFARIARQGPRRSE